MHLLIYRLRPDVYAICHAHPPIATGFAAAGLPLDKAILSEAVFSLGCVPLAPYGTPGTTELCDSIEPLLRSYDSILLANHGVVTYGPDLLTAFFRMETVEHFAQVSLVTQLLGKQTVLSASNVDKLLAARARYGKACSESNSEAPMAAEGEARTGKSRRRAKQLQRS
jgi:L-fuculose-phosphate aldolase